MKHIERLIKTPIKRIDYTVPFVPNPDFPVIDCGLGHSPLGYPEAIDAALLTVTPKLLNEYPEDAYAKGLSQSIRERFHLSQETYVYFNGAGSYGMLASVLSDLVSHEAVQKGLEVVGYGPQFTNIALLSDRAQIPYMAIQPELNASIEDKIDELIQHRKKNRSSAIVYVDNPNNPTGDVVSLETLQRLLEVTKKKDLVIIDEAYADLIVDENSAIPLVEQYPNLIVIRSISKGIGLASPRLGYAVMSQPLGEVYENFQLVYSVDAVTHLLGTVALNPKMLEHFLPAVRERTGELKRRFVSVLENHGLTVYSTHSDVSILMVQGPEKFYESLSFYSISSESGACFIPTYDTLNDSFVRFRIPGSEEEIEELDRRLTLMKTR